MRRRPHLLVATSPVVMAAPVRAVRGPGATLREAAREMRRPTTTRSVAIGVVAVVVAVALGGDDRPERAEQHQGRGRTGAVVVAYRRTIARRHRIGRRHVIARL